MNRYQEYDIIDAHTHIFPDKIVDKAVASIGQFYGIPMCLSGTCQDLITNGKKAGVKRFLVCSTATVASQVCAINQFVAEQCRRHPEFIGFGTLHPDMDDIPGEVERIIKSGLRGIKLHHDFQQFYIDEDKAFLLYEAIGDKLPILFHLGDERYDYSSPVRLSNVLRAYPQMRAIGAHFGGYKRWDEAARYLKLPNIYFDTSSTLAVIEKSYARELIAHFTPERMFFGTDYPMWRMDEELDRFFALELSEQENRQILAQNFVNYFSLGAL